MTKEIHDLKVGDLKPSPYEPKGRLDPKRPSNKELAVSIKGHGVMQPILVRPADDEKGYEIIYGHRRWACSKMAKLPTVPAEIRTDLSRADAMKLTVAENNQREDLDPLEEAEIVAAMLAEGVDTKEIGSILGGKSQRWVYMRAQLAKLSDVWRKAIEQSREREDNPPKEWDDSLFARYGSNPHRWPVSHFEAIAAMPVTFQERLHARFFPGDQYANRPGDPSTAALEKMIAEETRILGEAPFDPKDAELVPKAGACDMCPKRKGFAPDLFGLKGKPTLAKDTCLDAECFGQKIKAHIKALVTKENAIGLTETNKWRMSLSHDQASRLPDGVLYRGPSAFYQKGLKKDKGAVLGIVTRGDNLGKRVWVKELKVPKARNTGAPSGPRTIGEAREQLANRRIEAVEEDLYTALQENPDKHTPKTLRAVAEIIYLTCFWRGGESAETAAKVAKFSEAELAKCVFDYVEEMELPYSFSAAQRKAAYQLIAGHLSIDWEPIEKAAAEKHPEPAEWKGLKDDQLLTTAKKTKKAAKQTRK